MIVIRPIAKDDFPGYLKLAFHAHINFYTLPKSEKLLEHRFEKALHSFSEDHALPEKQFYLFVAEETATKQLLGVSALSATSGGSEPLFFFRKEHLTVQSPLAGVVTKLPILNPVSYLHGPSEVGSLFVDPASRGSGVGKLLSLSRFLFAARFPERFTGSFIAELRGPISNGSSLFWEAIGRHFFDVSFADVQEMMNYGRSFISHFLPEYPIYIDLLPQEVQDSIGQVDKETEPALALLERLGFHRTTEVDVIDGGPMLQAKKEAIVPIQKSVCAHVGKLDNIRPNEPHYLVANEALDFRACLAPIMWRSPTSIAISPEVAAHLKLALSDPVRIFDPKERAT